MSDEPTKDTIVPSDADMAHVLAAGSALGSPMADPDGGGIYTVVPAGYKLEDLERFLLAPVRQRGDVTCETVDALIDYYKRFCDEEASLVFARCEDFHVVGVLDWHKPGDKAGFGEHRVVYEAPRSDEWKIWTEADGTAMSQFDFATFIEDNVKDIREPAGADVLEVARNLEAKKRVDFKSGIRLADGQRQFTYKEEINGTTRDGQMEVPEQFILGIPVFRGGVLYRVTARLRYRIESGNLRLWYDLLNPHVVARDAFAAIVTKVDEAVPTAVLMAKAPA